MGSAAYRPWLRSRLGWFEIRFGMSIIAVEAKHSHRQETPS